MSSKVSEKELKGMIEAMINNVNREEIRTLAKQTFDIPTIKIWLEHCQEKAKKGSKHGYVHQDLINLLGERLGFDVTYGEIHGPDGIWKYDKLSIVVESKANIQWKGTLPETKKFISDGQGDYGIVVSSSFDEEDLNTVKGPDYSAKLRLITTEALCKLASLKNDGILDVENVKDILIPQETHLLDNIVDIIYGIREQITKPKPPEVSFEEQERLSKVPESIRDYSDDLKAMYIVLKENPNSWFDPTDLSEKIKERFPRTFAQKLPYQIAWTFPFGAKFLERKGLIEIKEDPKYEGRRNYRFKSK